MRQKMRKASYGSRPSKSQCKPELLLGRDGVLGCLCYAEFHHGLRFNLDRFTSLGVASHAGFAMRLHQPSKTRNHKHAVLLGFLHRRVAEMLQECRYCFIVGLKLFREMAYELCLCHTSCHKFSPLQ